MTHRIAVSWLPEDCSLYLAHKVRAAVGLPRRASATEARPEVGTSPLSVIHGSRYATGLTMILEAASETDLDAAYARVLDTCSEAGTGLPFAHAPVDADVACGDTALASPYIGYYLQEKPGQDGPFGAIDVAYRAPGQISLQAMSRVGRAAPSEGNAGCAPPAPMRRLLHANLHGLSARAGRPALHAYGLGGYHVVAAGGKAAFSTVMRSVLRRHLDWWLNHPVQIHLAAIEHREEALLDATAMDHITMRGRTAVLHGELPRLYYSFLEQAAGFSTGRFQMQVRVDGARVWLVMNATLHGAFVECPGLFDLSWPDRVGRAYGMQPARAVNAGDNIRTWTIPRIGLQVDVVLTCDLPVVGLRKGAKGTVQALACSPDGAAWTVQFLDDDAVVIADVAEHHLEAWVAGQHDGQGVFARRPLSLMQQSYLRMLRRQS